MLGQLQEYRHHLLATGLIRVRPVRRSPGRAPRSLPLPPAATLYANKAAMSSSPSCSPSKASLLNLSSLAEGAE